MTTFTYVYKEKEHVGQRKIQTYTLEGKRSTSKHDAAPQNGEERPELFRRYPVCPETKRTGPRKHPVQLSFQLGKKGLGIGHDQNTVYECMKMT